MTPVSEATFGLPLTDLDDAAMVAAQRLRLVASCPSLDGAVTITAAKQLERAVEADRQRRAEPSRCWPAAAGRADSARSTTGCGSCCRSISTSSSRPACWSATTSGAGRSSAPTPSASFSASTTAALGHCPDQGNPLMRAISAEVLDTLDQSICSGNSLRLPPGLHRKLYDGVNKVIEAAGGRWNRRAGAHLFDGDARDAMDQIILTGGVGAKQELGQFDTPPELAAQVVGMADIEPGMTVLEPSAGIGNLAKPVLGSGGKILAIEIDPKRCRQLVGNLSGCDAMVLEGDFLAFEAAKQIGRSDRVVMNPPFARQADIDHVMAAARCLKPGGILVAVMSAGIGFRINAKTTQFRQWLAERDGVVEALPPGSFKASGTGVSACIVKLQGRA